MQCGAEDRVGRRVAQAVRRSVEAAFEPEVVALPGGGFDVEAVDAYGGGAKEAQGRWGLLHV